MIDINKYTKQELTIYEDGGLDLYARPIEGMSNVVPCRFSNKSLIKVDANGDKFQINATCYVLVETQITTNQKVEFDGIKYTVYDMYTPVTVSGVKNHKKLLLKLCSK